LSHCRGRIDDDHTGIGRFQKVGVGLLGDAALTLDALADALGPAPTAAVDQHGDVADAADGGERIAQRTTALTSLSNHHARRGPARSNAEMALGGRVPPGIPWP